MGDPIGDPNVSIAKLLIDQVNPKDLKAKCYDGYV